MTLITFQVRGRRSERPLKRAQIGLSLIELMVGLTIGLFLTLGMFTLLANSSQFFKIQDDFSRMQENATSALRYMGDSVRMAGFDGYAQDPSTIDITTNNVSVNNDCGSAANLPVTNWAVAMVTNGQPSPIYGWRGGITGLTQATVNGVFPCILATNFQAYSPILVTRGAGGYAMPDPNGDGNVTDGIEEQDNYANTIYIQAAPSLALNIGGTPYAGTIFYGNQFANLRATGQTVFLPNGNDIDVFEYHAYVYYIRPCSNPAIPPNCGNANDDGGHPIPTLVRQELNGTTMTEVPLVEGVDMLSFQYGVDDYPSGSDYGVPSYYTATPAPNEWQNVVTVKIGVLVRSPNFNINYNDSGNTYDLVGDGITATYTCTTYVATNPLACQYKRKVFSQTFQLRNIVGRRLPGAT